MHGYVGHDFYLSSHPPSCPATPREAQGLGVPRRHLKMQTYNPPHEPRDRAKLAAMVETIIAGDDLPAILVNGETAITGGHPIAAYQMAERDPRCNRDLEIPPSTWMTASWMRR